MSRTVPKPCRHCVIAAALLWPLPAVAQAPGAEPDKPAPPKPPAEAPAGATSDKPAPPKPPAEAPGAGASDKPDPLKPAAQLPVESTTTYREATVRAMWIKPTPKILGGSSPFTVRVSPNRSGDAAVGLIEQVLGSAGDTWKSSAWIAAVAASNAGDQLLLTDNEFLLKVRGFIEGPSAGMLMATTMLALMNHDPIRPGVTITGTVNPDGTIGPVGGLEEKVEGARKAGIKELGYPMIDNGDDGKIFKDLERLGKEKGVVMVAIPDINAAYHFLTTRGFGDPKPVPEAEMRISPALADKYKDAIAGLIKEARERLARGEKMYDSVKAKLSEKERKSYSLTSEYIRKAESFVEEKAWVMAHSKAMMADGSARMGEKFLQWMQCAGDTTALSAMYIEEHKTAEKMLEGLQAQVATTLNAPTLAGRITGLNDRLNYWSVQAQWLATNAGREEIRKRQTAFDKKVLAAAKGKKAVPKALIPESQEIAILMRDHMQWLAVLESRIRAFSDFAGLTFDENKQPAPDHVVLNKRLAEAYGPAAAAGLAYFQSNVVRPYEGSDSVVAETKRARRKNDILLHSCTKAAEHAVRRADDGENGESSDDSPEQVADRFACGAYAYLGMSGLMNKYYNLADNDEDADPGQEVLRDTVTLRKGNTVTRMMERSRTRVLKEASLVKEKLQFIPECIKMNFCLGETKRHEEDDTAKLDALTSYWRAQFLCKMAQLMTRSQ